MQETVILTLATMVAIVATLLAVMLWRAFARAPALARLRSALAGQGRPRPQPPGSMRFWG